MEALTNYSIPLDSNPMSVAKTRSNKPNFFTLQLNPAPPGSPLIKSERNLLRSKLFSTKSVITSSVPHSESTELPNLEHETEVDSSGPQQQKSEGKEEEEKFDWFAQWYPIMPVCDMDKRIPHAKKVMGLDVVVWWDRNGGSWRVFEDSCPHRLAPLSEGRIDQWGRLQCVYHGWCFNGAGDCRFIPQAPREGLQVQASKKACVAVYPSVVHQEIVWFWPNADPRYKDIIFDKKPPTIPELDDPSYTKTLIVREFPIGYEILLENLMDPAHLPYAHYEITRNPDILSKFRGKQPVQPEGKSDREGGTPLDMGILKLDKNGFLGKQEWESVQFMAPCIYYSHIPLPSFFDLGSGGESSTKQTQKLSGHRRGALVFYCVPVSPGKSRLISLYSRNYHNWTHRIVPRWIHHMGTNLLLDSDLYLLHVEEHKIKDIGSTIWHKSCFVPTKSDAFVVGFRRWLNKYAGAQVDWRGKYSGDLPLTPPRDLLFDRYWTHTAICSSCNSACKAMNVLEVILQVVAIVFIGVIAAAKHGFVSANARTAMVMAAIACFAASKWLAHFIRKNFHYHDYNHALV